MNHHSSGGISCQDTEAVRGTSRETDKAGKLAKGGKPSPPSLTRVKMVPHAEREVYTSDRKTLVDSKSPSLVRYALEQKLSPPHQEDSCWGGRLKETSFLLTLEARQQSCDHVRMSRSPRRASMTTQPNHLPRVSLAVIALCTLLGLTILWSYWTTLGVVVWRWTEDPQYGHGYLVPAFAAYFLWLRRNRLSGQELGMNALGLGLIILALGVRLAGAYY